MDGPVCHPSCVHLFRLSLVLCCVRVFSACFFVLCCVRFFFEFRLCVLRARFCGSLSPCFLFVYFFTFVLSLSHSTPLPLSRFVHEHCFFVSSPHFQLHSTVSLFLVKNLSADWKGVPASTTPFSLYSLSFSLRRCFPSSVLCLLPLHFSFAVPPVTSRHESHSCISFPVSSCCDGGLCVRPHITRPV